MSTYKTKSFSKWAKNEGLTDEVLEEAVEELTDGKGDPLGGHVWKIRVALPGRGKRGGARTLIAYKSDSHAFFLYGFPKSQRANIKKDELKALKLLAKVVLGYTDSELAKAVSAKELIEL